jgi:2-polyprenyl-6-methoxyphenol hydroxylase-like FAD-dependent oxidoreductase
MQPILADRVSTLTDWKQIAVLSVESSRVTTWFRPGLLLIGDAAHVMSPVGGVGINYAIQDAVEAANLLAGPLADGKLGPEHLAAVQSARELPVKVIQFFQRMIQNRILSGVLASKGAPPSLPPPLRILLKIPFLRALPAASWRSGSESQDSRLRRASRQSCRALKGAACQTDPAVPHQLPLADTAIVRLRHWMNSNLSEDPWLEKLSGLGFCWFLRRH